MADEELAIGIDLGTTFSCVAVLRSGNVEIIPNEEGQNLTPSIVSFAEDISFDENKVGVFVGEETLNQLIKNPKKTIYSIKRLMGRNYNDDEVKKDIASNFWAFDVVPKKSKEGNQQRPVVKITDKNNKVRYYYPEEISKFILQKLVKSAKDYLGQPVKKAVITVPAYFQDAHRKATKFAAEEAGLEVLRIINEPTAASLAYGLDIKLPKNDLLSSTFIDINKGYESNRNHKKENEEEDDEKYIVVFDLGGGTFDVTLLKIDDKEIFNAIYTEGDSHLGGDDFNQKIMEYCLDEFCLRLNIDKKEVKKDSKAMNRLKIASENAKIKLSSETETSINIDDFYNNEILSTKLTRIKFEEICQDLFKRLLKPLDNVVVKCPKSLESINEIVFVGGSTRIPHIKEIVQSYFYDIHINDSINPDETVAYGAAIQAAKLNKQGGDILNDVILMDITPFSLGIDVVNNSDIPEIKAKGCLMSVVIPKGTKIPVSKTGNYKTAHDNQEVIDIGVYEGENPYVNDNHLLGNFKLVGLPKKPAGEVKDDVTFYIDENGILTVTAVEKSQGINNSIKIINDKGFQKDEILENINNTYTPLIKGNHGDFKNYKKEMNYYYKEYHNTYNIQEKYKYIYNFGKTLIAFLNTFDKEGNDTLGNKYFLYIKVLFESYRILIQLNKSMSDGDKQMIIDNSKNYLKLLSNFKNINYSNYVELLNLFVIYLNDEEVKEPLEKRQQIKEWRNYILFDLVIYVMELINQRADLILFNNLKFSRYNAKYLFQNVIKISELYIKSERELSINMDLRNRYNKCINKCKEEIKKINANSLVNINQIKNSKKLIEKEDNVNREDLLILMDNFREAYQNIQGLNETETEAIILANIVKIDYVYLGNTNYNSLRRLAEQSVALAKSTEQNVEKYQWYLDISSILQELRNNFEEQERLEQEKFENKCKTEHKEIFDKIKEYRAKSNIEFIEYILQNHPPKKNPLKKNKTVSQKMNEDSKTFLETLSARYNPDNYSRNTDEEKLNYTIMKTISIEINAILSEISPAKII